jgi:hypothetical protein
MNIEESLYYERVDELMRQIQTLKEELVYEMERRKKAQHTWYDHNLELRVSGNRREKPHTKAKRSNKEQRDQVLRDSYFKTGKDSFVNGEDNVRGES